MDELRPGTNVKIRGGLRVNRIGTFTGMHKMPGGEWYKVRFPDGIQYVYARAALLPV